MILVSKHICHKIQRKIPRRLFDSYEGMTIIKPLTESYIWVGTNMEINGVIKQVKDDISISLSHNKLMANSHGYRHAKHSLAGCINWVFRKTLSALHALAPTLPLKSS